MRVLGIDPGTLTTGWGVVEEQGSRLVRVAGGVVHAHGPLAERLAAIFTAVEEVLARFAPTTLSIEKSFVAANVQSAFRLGEARGAILAAAARAHVLVREYSPAEIKLAVVGTGRATKPQVQEMVRRLLGLREAIAGDQADALGAAICHLHARRVAERLGTSQLGDLVRTARGRGGRRWLSLPGGRATPIRSAAQRRSR